MLQDFSPYLTIAKAISSLLHPLAEVVIHDLKTDTIHSIFNPISKREAGDPSYLERFDFSHKNENDIIGPYSKLNFDGRTLKSISMVLKKGKKIIGLLCINMDISAFAKHQTLLNQLLTIESSAVTQEQETLFKDDLYEKINTFVQAYCREHCLSFDALRKEDKQALIFQLKEEGALKAKNATNYIAKTLNISRATVYNYLK